MSVRVNILSPAMQAASERPSYFLGSSGGMHHHHQRQKAASIAPLSLSLISIHIFTAAFLPSFAVLLLLPGD